MNELTTRSKELELNDRIRDIAVAMGSDMNPSTGEMVKTPIEIRIKKSKFNKIITGMTDDDLKLTAYAICFNKSVAEAVKCYHTSVVNYTQVAALLKELNSRDIEIIQP
ncbi:MAG: hypothetical protein COA78_11980 [Blastopirellula sp.]|nr:MAG: hypothetical protein COA78_11980 [Blastopirellula sp.]